MDIQAMVQSAIPLLTQLALKVVGALVLWVIGRRLIEFGRRLVVRSLKYPFDQTVATYIGTAVSVILNIALIIYRQVYFDTNRAIREVGGDAGFRRPSSTSSSGAAPECRLGPDERRAR